MEGRLEHEFMTTKNIENNILVDLPQCVTDYYYSMGGLVKTKEDYLKKIRKFVHYVKTELGKEDICQVTMTEVDRYFDKEIKFKTVKTTDKNGNVEIKKVPTSYSHQKVTHTALNNFFEFLVEREYVLKNPVSPKKRPKRQKDEKKTNKKHI